MPIAQTHFKFPHQVSVYHGKVRDVYTIGNDYIVLIATDRISAFDVILPRPIPYKGQILNQIASKFLKSCIDICPNWFITSPHPRVTIGYRCEPIRIEIVVRAFLTGHAWRTYASGQRSLCGISLPDGLREHDRLPHPIITPAVKADEGHDADISREEILAQKIVSLDEWNEMARYALDLFERGAEIASKQGLILVDTKYEFGKRNDMIYLMDEIHTPDSSRYFYANHYESLQKEGKPQRHLSKEFVREWLIAQNFQGKEGQSLPVMNTEVVETISQRYIELFEQVVGKKFSPATNDTLEDIEKAILLSLENLKF